MRIGPVRALGSQAVFLLESSDATCGVDNLLLAGIERMAHRADFNREVFCERRVRRERIAASTPESDLRKFWMYALFHDCDTMSMIEKRA